MIVFSVGTNAYASGINNICHKFEKSRCILIYWDNLMNSNCLLTILSMRNSLSSSYLAVFACKIGEISVVLKMITGKLFQIYIFFIFHWFMVNINVDLWFWHSWTLGLATQHHRAVTNSLNFQGCVCKKKRINNILLLRLISLTFSSDSSQARIVRILSFIFRWM